LAGITKEDQIHLDKANIMLLGPSGVGMILQFETVKKYFFLKGKTYIVKVLAKILDVPLAHCDWYIFI